MNNIKYLVYTTDLENTSFVQAGKTAGANCISVLDARSAAYFATGICAQNKEKVVVCVNGSNASRSVFSGMTEAFYRKLPVALITFGKSLDYTKELNDVVMGHYSASSISEVDQMLNKEFPMHIELLNEYQEHEKVECNYLQQILRSVLDEKSYLYISQGIKDAMCQYRGKVVHGGMPDCYEGALANVLGASLAGRRERYIGLVSENEFLHDINTLGNININDSIFYIIVGIKKNKTIIGYAESLQFKVSEIKYDKLRFEDIERLNSNRKKSLLMVYKGE